MQADFANLAKNLPFYLTQPQKEELAKTLATFPNIKNYYIGSFGDEILQGDVWSDLRVVDFESGNKKQVKGILLSNSCDIASENKRAVIPKVVFAPIVPLSRYAEVLRRSGQDERQVEDKLKAFRAQQPTSFFWLPAGGGLEEEHIVSLDDVHSIPLNHFQASKEKRKFATLSQVGFYIFLIKLTVHFCRMHEAVPRFDVDLSKGINTLALQ